MVSPLFHIVNIGFHIFIELLTSLLCLISGISGRIHNVKISQLSAFLREGALHHLQSRFNLAAGLEIRRDFLDTIKLEVIVTEKPFKY